MKKWIAGMLTVFMGVVSLSIPFVGLHTAEAGVKDTSDKKLKIVTTIFPEYDWTRAVLGEREADVELTMLLADSLPYTEIPLFYPCGNQVLYGTL